MYGLKKKKKKWAISPSPSKKSSWGNNLKFPSLHCTGKPALLLLKGLEGEESVRGLLPAILSPLPHLSDPPQLFPPSHGHCFCPPGYQIRWVLSCPQPHSIWTPLSFCLHIVLGAPPFWTVSPWLLGWLPSLLKQWRLQYFRAQFWSSSPYKLSASDFVQLHSFKDHILTLIYISGADFHPRSGLMDQTVYSKLPTGYLSSISRLLCP